MCRTRRLLDPPFTVPAQEIPCDRIDSRHPHGGRALWRPRDHGPTVDGSFGGHRHDTATVQVVRPSLVQHPRVTGILVGFKTRRAPWWESGPDPGRPRRACPGRPRRGRARAGGPVPVPLVPCRRLFGRREEYRPSVDPAGSTASCRLGLGGSVSRAEVLVQRHPAIP